MKKKHLNSMPDDLTTARKSIGRVRATVAELLDDSNIATGKTWKRLNKLYRALDNAAHELGNAEDRMQDVLPKLLKHFEKQD